MANYVGTSANELVFGSLFEDNFFSGFGVGLDRVTGGSFNDVFKVGAMNGGRDVFDGGAGRDHLDLASAQLPPTLTIRLADSGQTGSMASRQTVGFSRRSHAAAG